MLQGNEFLNAMDTLSADVAAVPQRLSVGVCSYIYICVYNVLLTPQLGLSPPEQRSCWECNQFHL